MIVYSLLAVTLLFAFLSLRMALRSAGVLHRVFLAVATGMVTYLYGAWVFVSVYLQYVFAGCFVVVLLYALLRRQNKVKATGRVPILASWFFAAIFSVLSILYFTGTTGKPYGVAHLAWPLKSGNYFVFQGGKGLPTNLFHYKLRGAVYAMDIVHLNSMGNRAKRIFSTHLQDYEIFGDTLYSPCNGRIMHVENDNPDNTPPNPKRGPTNTNHILMANSTMYLFMAHLRHGCVFVHDGDSVTVGQPIACCGNSGFSIEPHLHIQAHARTDEQLPWYKEQPLLILFNERYYRLFEEIRIR